MQVQIENPMPIAENVINETTMHSILGGVGDVMAKAQRNGVQLKAHAGNGGALVYK